MTSASAEVRVIRPARHNWGENGKSWAKFGTTVDSSGVVGGVIVCRESPAQDVVVRGGEGASAGVKLALMFDSGGE
jgi:hypothetical protein